MLFPRNSFVLPCAIAAVSISLLFFKIFEHAEPKTCSEDINDRVSLQLIESLSPTKRKYAPAAEVVKQLQTIESEFAHGDFTKQGKVVTLLLSPIDAVELPYIGHGNWNPLVDEARCLDNFPNIQKWLSASLESRNSIGKALSHELLEVRQQAVFVLSELEAEDQAEKLAKFGLTSDDLTIQFFACRAIAKAYGVQPVYNGDFQTNVDKYVERYKKLASFVDRSNSPLTVSKLDDPRPVGAFNRDISFSYCSASDIESVAQSDLIVVGKLQPLSQTSSDRLARISIERVLKNSAHKNLDNVIVSTFYGATFDKGLYILKSQPDGKYQCVYGAFLQGLPSAPHLDTIQTKPIESIAAELIAVVSTPQKQLSIGRELPAAREIKTAAIDLNGHTLTEHAYKRQLNCTDEDFAYASAVSALRALPSKKIIPLLQQKLASSDLEESSRLWISNALFSMGDYNALDAVQETLQSDTPLSASSDCALTALCQTISNGTRGKTVADTKEVSAFINSKRVRVRRAVAQALKYLASSDDSRNVAISALATSGLYDNDIEVRFKSVESLKDMLGPIVTEDCTYEQFAADQSKYITRMRRVVSVLQ